MPRTLRFRAWDIENNKMWEGEDVCGNHRHLNLLSDSARFDFMQFTGLHDSKGKEIYEGDIVYLAGYGDYEVSWPFRELFDAAAENDIGEIKGNIYFTPQPN